MRQVRLEKGSITNEDRSPIACPWSANPRERLWCGDWCPHFRVDASQFLDMSGDAHVLKVVRISCSGQDVELEVVE